MRDTAEDPLVVGIGGTARPGSTTDRALRIALEAARGSGARTLCLGGRFIAGLPAYEPQSPIRTPDVRRLLQAVRAADGVLIASPGYHGGLSGVVKNALDFLEDLRDDERPYLDGRAVGCIVTAFGWQACTTTLTSLRAVVHALRGWPTPLGATLNTATGIFDAGGSCTDRRAALELGLVARQVVQFAHAHVAPANMEPPVPRQPAEV
jgi:FMN reductase